MKLGIETHGIKQEMEARFGDNAPPPPPGKEYSLVLFIFGTFIWANIFFHFCTLGCYIRRTVITSFFVFRIIREKTVYIVGFSVIYIFLYIYVSTAWLRRYIFFNLISRCF